MNIVRALFTAALISAAALAFPDSPSTAFYYGAAPPVKTLGLYDWVVIDAGNAEGSNWQPLARESLVHCYLSVGESQGERAAQHRALIVGDNPGWQSKVMDVAHPGWRDALILEAQQLAAAGCEGLFLDTLDSYQLAFEERDWPRAEQGLADIVLALHAAQPDLAIMLNRGFEIFDRVSAAVTSMTVEGLYQGWNADKAQHKTISEDERRWLLGELQAVEAAGKAIIVLDYLPATATAAEATSLARRIADHGFTPWVTDVSLMHLGTGFFTPLPREVALLYHPGSSDFAGHDAHILLGAALDYAGYDVRPYNVSKGMPVLIKGVHAGVVTWFDDTQSSRSQNADAWEDVLTGALTHNIPLALFGAPPPLSAAVLDRLGVKRVAGSNQKRAALVEARTGYGDFEAPAAAQEHVTVPFRNTSAANQPWVTMTLDDEAVVPVLTGPWGGYAQHPYLLQAGFGGQRRWLLNPFAFLATALHSQPAPIPDTTTETGRRILLSWVDGDGFPSRAELPGTPYSAEVLLEKVFKPIKLPHTVSVIEGEVAATGLYPHLSGELEPLARKIFALGNVELASHSFSHPFFWARRQNIDISKTLYGLGLPIPGYTTDTRREVAGSVRYINDTLAPEGKRTEVFLWTGDAVPGGGTVRLVEELGLVNLNGGNTQVRNALPSSVNIYPQSRWTDGGHQIYAPIMNENVYTNDWTGPFHGFRRVIETFKRTEDPRRLKPLGIYYHFYSGTKPGALNALLDVYGYAEEQPHNALYASEYARRVLGYHSARITRSLDGHWLVDQLGALRTVRLPEPLVPPDVLASENVAGWLESKDGIYVHLTGTPATLVLGERPAPALAWSNGQVERWAFEGDREATIHLRGHEPLKFAVRWGSTCTLRLAGGQRLTGKNEDGMQVFRLNARDTGTAQLVCR